MIICICSNINESTVKDLIKQKKIKNVREFIPFNICVDCKKCSSEIKRIIRETRCAFDN